ncbi:MAG: bacteriocin family protein [Anaerolineae bacterium]|nr:bacteriocin family protein [Anaerolineae bacterium]
MVEHILMREDAPLSAAQWQLVDQNVANVAARVMVGRRVLDLYGPLGFGVYTVPLYTYGGEESVRAKIVGQLSMQTLAKDFAISAKDLELMNSGQPFDVAPVSAVATRIARAEDQLIFNGDAEAGVDGLLTVKGRQTFSLGDWDEEGAALQEVSTAIAHLVSEGYYGPHYVIMHPLRYTKLQRVYGRRGVLEVDLLERQASGGILSTPTLPPDKVLVIAAQSQYVDLAVGLDLSVAFIETADMEHRFRLLETLSLRIKQPAAICTLE